MKNLIRRPIVITLLAGLAAASLHAAPETLPAVDFGKLPGPASGGEFVEVNVSSNLIAMAVRLAKDAEPEITGALRNLQRIHVNVIGLDDGNRAQVQERVKTIRTDLDTQGWERLVAVQQDEQNVVVQIKTKGDQLVQGLMVTIFTGKKQAVLVNIVGDIDPDKLALIGERFDIDPLKKLQLQGKKKS